MISWYDMVTLFCNSNKSAGDEYYKHNLLIIISWYDWYDRYDQ